MNEHESVHCCRQDSLQRQLNSCLCLQEHASAACDWRDQNDLFTTCWGESEGRTGDAEYAPCYLVICNEPTFEVRIIFALFLSSLVALSLRTYVESATYQHVAFNRPHESQQEANIALATRVSHLQSKFSRPVEVCGGFEGHVTNKLHDAWWRAMRHFIIIIIFPWFTW